MPVAVAVDNSLPDYLVAAELYAARMRVLWQPGDRFRMFFGGKISSKTHKKVKTGARSVSSPASSVLVCFICGVCLLCGWPVTAAEGRSCVSRPARTSA